MKKTDILSQLVQFKTGKDDSRDITLLPSRFFAMPLSIFEPALQNLDKLRQHHLARDKLVTRALQEQHKDWKEEDQIVTFQERFYVPRSEALRGEIIHAHHDHPTAGHPGHYKTLELISRNYFWPGMSKDIRRYVMGCDACQRTEPKRTPDAAPLHPHDVPPRPWHTISMDLVGPLPISQGHDTILVVVDRFSKQMHAVPTTSNLTVEGCAKLLRDNVFRLHRVPSKIIHDRGPQFQSKFAVDFYRLMVW